MTHFENRVRTAQETDTLLNALKVLETVDFDTYMGSGILVNLDPITEKHKLTGEFMINGEDMKEIAPLLAQSIRAALQFRMNARQCEVQRIAKIVKQD